MATINYYYNAGSASSSNFANIANAYDGNDTTYAQNVYKIGGSPSTETAYLTGNACNGSSLGLITKVEYRVKVYGDKKSTVGFNSRVYMTSRPYFGGSSAGTTTTRFDSGLNDSAYNYAAQWSAYTDITNDTNAPTWGTDWTNVSGLDIRVVAYWSAGVIGTDNVDRLYECQLRVTYIPHGSFQVI